MGLLKVDNVVHWSIPVNDLAESEKFYGKVLDLTFRGLGNSCGPSAPSRLSRHDSSVVVVDVDVGRAGIGPSEDDSPLVVDADAMEPSQASLERLGPIARRRRQIRRRRRVVEHVELPGGHPPDVRPADALHASPRPEESLA